jgi:hypothetical protein
VTTISDRSSGAWSGQVRAPACKSLSNGNQLIEVLGADSAVPTMIAVLM